MKTIKFIGILALITNFAAYGQMTENKAKIPDGWKSISDNTYSINYPDNWVLNTSGQMGSSFILFTPLSSKQDQFRENVNLIIQDLTGHNLDLDKYVALSENQIKTMVTNGEIIESKRITTGNLDYQKVIYTGKQGLFNLKFEQYFWVIGNKAFILTFTCEESQFDNYQATAEKIMNSFKIKKEGKTQK